MFFASTMLMVSIALVMAVIVTNIYAKKNTSQRCPAWAVHLASRIFPSYGLPERESNASLVSLTSGKDPELQPTPNPSRQTPPRPRKPCDWPTNGKTAAAAAATSGTGKRGTSPGTVGGVSRRGAAEPGGGGAAERRARRMQRTTASVSIDSMLYPQAARQNSEEGSVVSQERADRARLKAEWRLAALMADRVFLWAFVALSVATHASLLVQMMLQHSFGD